MSAETISAALPRAIDYARPADSSTSALATEQPGETGLNQRIEAAGRSNASQSQGRNAAEDQQSNLFFVRTNSLRGKPVTYPDPGPSLPEPLVPIREVPLPDHVIVSNPVREQLEEEQSAGTEQPTDRLLNQASRLNAEASSSSTLPGRTDESAAEDARMISKNTIGAGPAADEEGRRASGADHTLESIVLAQGRNAPEHENPDSEFTGRLVSVTG
jgi:hypothetical protein